MKEYRCYQSPVEEDFRGIALLVNQRLSSYKVPCGINWLTHIKVFSYAQWAGPLHIMGIYLKLRENHRCARGELLATVKRLVNQVLTRDEGAKIIVLGDFNEKVPKVMRHFGYSERVTPLATVQVAGSTLTRIPNRGGQRQALDHILLTKLARTGLQSAKVHCEYSSSDHQPLVIRPKARLPGMIYKEPYTSFNSKIISLKGDLIANDNSWQQLMARAYGKEFLKKALGNKNSQAVVINQAGQFISTFDQVCKKHAVKKVH
jgi:hypothetical protein